MNRNPLSEHLDTLSTVELIDLAAKCTEMALDDIQSLSRRKPSSQNARKMGALACSVHNIPAIIGRCYSKPDTEQAEASQILQLKKGITAYIQAEKMPRSE